MRFLPIIALFALIGCASSKQEPVKPRMPTCEEFYAEYEQVDRNLGLELGSSVVVLKEMLDDMKNKYAGSKYEKYVITITCNGNDYWLGPSFKF